VSLGWYESELIRHADPAGRTLGRYFSEEIAAPLGLNFWIGLPASVDRNRIANLHTWSGAEALLHVNTMPPGFVVGLLNPFSLTGRAFKHPRRPRTRRP
jgi:CubicO group peptidase (beta-lactamase class C family)